MESYYYSSKYCGSGSSTASPSRPSSPVGSMHSIRVLRAVPQVPASGEELSLNRAACAAVCAVERGSVGHETFYYQLVTGRFRAELLLILQAAGQSVQAETNVSIATPVSVDWEDVILYEGFTFRIAPVNDMSTEEEHALVVQFPRADGWLKDDFIPAVVALIELAEVILNCDRLFVCVEREVAEANSLVRSLMYAGFAISPFSEPSNYLVLEYETE